MRVHAPPPCQSHRPRSEQPEWTKRGLETGKSKGVLPPRSESSTTGATRAEFEYPIPHSDADALLALCEARLVEKTRYRLHHAGHCWEIDEFHGDNAGLVVAEVELEHENDAVEIPPWNGAEVTDDPRYFDSSLAAYPYCRWALHADG